MNKQNAIIHYTGLTMVGATFVAPKGDTTQKRRQSRRREKLNEIAKAAGFASWSAYETAVINGLARLI